MFSKASSYYLHETTLTSFLQAVSTHTRNTGDLLCAHSFPFSSANTRGKPPPALWYLVFSTVRRTQSRIIAFFVHRPQN